MKRYEYLGLFISIKDNKNFRRILSNNFHTFSKIINNFEKIFILDIHNLKTFKNKNDLDKNIINELFPNSNIKFSSPRNFLELIKFLKNKKIIALHMFGTSYNEIVLNFFLRFFDIKFFQINNIGNVQYGSYSISNNKTLGVISYLKKNLSHKITVFLSNLGIIHKINMRFISNSDYFKYKKLSIKNKIFNFFNLSYVNSLILINSRSYDIFLENKLAVDDSLITVLDEQLNEPQWTRYRKRFNNEQINLHYNKFNSYLKKLSIILNKEVIICIHPSDDLEYKQKIFKEFKVVKFQTRENIYKSFLVVFFESSAIIDAILLNKNITTVQSSILDKNQIASGIHYVNELSAPISNIDIMSEINFDKNYLIEKKIIKSSSELKKNYNNYIKKYICADRKNLTGVGKIVEMIKDKYKLK